MRKPYVQFFTCLIGLAVIISSAFAGFWFVNGQLSNVPASLAAASPPPGATVRTQVEVPASMRTGPFTSTRYLNVPPDFSIAVYARIPRARFMAIAPNGDLLVSVPNDGKVVLVRPNASGNPIISDFVTGLRRPHDIVFHTISGITYVYIAETHQINRYIYNNGDTRANNRQIVVSGLPDSSTPELGGTYSHELKNIALDGNNKLYVSIASTCNACLSDTVSNPVRGSIYQYDADGRNGRLFARGLRNAEGLAFVPGTNDLWVAVNNRDNILYPFNDGTGNYGKVVPQYVDNHPPEEFTKVRDGGNYGWPFCNPNPDTASGLNNMPFDRDVEFNANGQVNCDTMDRINKGIQAHSAPLGLLFLQNTQFAEQYRQGAVIGLHGSWNRTSYTGYKVVYFPWDATTQNPGDQIDLVTGWLDDNSQNYWGRPVDIAVDLQGNMLISDDGSGTIYKLRYQGTTATPTPTTNTPTPTPTTINTPPVVTLTAPTNGATFTAPASISLAASASAASSKTISRVEFYNGTTLLGTDTSSPYTYIWNNVAAGTYTITARAYDNTGASATSPPITLTVNGNTGSQTCQIKYTVNQWNTGFTANIVITNKGTTPINGWTLSFTFPGNQQITQSWNGQYTQQGPNVTIRDAGYNASIPVNGTVNPGFNGSYSGSNPNPTSFTLNGQPCSIG